MKRFDLRNVTSDTFKAAIGVLSLALLLAYTFRHTATLLARYVDPDWYGYAAAAGVELAIVSLSLRIGELRRSGRTALGFYAVLVAVLAVSAFANVAEGYATLYGDLLTLTNIARVDALQAIIGVAATGLLSVIVLALSEIIGTDVRRAAQVSERAERTLRRQVAPASEPAPDPALQPVAAPPAALAAPAQVVAPTAQARWTCPRCGAPFDVQQRYAAHMRRCTGTPAQPADALAQAFQTISRIPYIANDAAGAVNGHARKETSS